eukprot:gene17044-48233_t
MWRQAPICSGCEEDQSEERDCSPLPRRRGGGVSGRVLSVPRPTAEQLEHPAEYREAVVMLQGRRLEPQQPLADAGICAQQERHCLNGTWGFIRGDGGQRNWWRRLIISDQKGTGDKWGAHLSVTDMDGKSIEGEWSQTNGYGPGRFTAT